MAAPHLVRLLASIKVGLLPDPFNGKLAEHFPADMLRLADQAVPILFPGRVLATGPWEARHANGRRCGHRHTERGKAAACAARLGDGWSVQMATVAAREP
ncbi:MAG: hypothetical protein GX442_24265 [Candidatus Riflebacteria bacterium]|nr:hypothetical protein [Candidatus Riflebacteria bacterium]